MAVRCWSTCFGIWSKSLTFSKTFAFVAATALAGCAYGPRNFDAANSHLVNLSYQSVYAIGAEVSEYLKTNSQDDAIAKGKEAVANGMKDPFSAVFKDLRLMKFRDMYVTCGQVNAKNSYGGYVGFRDFVAGISKYDAYDTDTKYPAITAASNKAIKDACNLP